MIIIISKKKITNRTENKHRKSPKENFVTGTSCALLLEVPGFHSFLQNTREKRRIATTSNGTETQRYVHQQQNSRKEKETTWCVWLSF